MTWINHFDEYGNDKRLIGISYYPKFLQLWDTEHKYLIFCFDKKDGNITLQMNYIDCYEEIQL